MSDVVLNRTELNRLIAHQLGIVRLNVEIANGLLQKMNSCVNMTPLFNNPWYLQDERCHYCECDLIRFDTPEGMAPFYLWDEDKQVYRMVMGFGKYTRDHKIPTSKGGSNTLANMVACCERCNREKGAMDYEEYMEKVQLNRRFIPVIGSNQA